MSARSKVDAYAPFSGRHNKINTMDEIKIRECGLVSVNAQELQMRGGISWKDLIRLAKYIEKVINFVDDYKVEIERGFKKGWEMF